MRVAVLADRDHRDRIQLDRAARAVAARFAAELAALGAGRGAARAERDFQAVDRDDRGVARLLRLAHDGLALGDAVHAREQTADDVADLGFSHVGSAARLASAALCRAWE